MPPSDAVEKLLFTYILPNCQKLEPLEFRHDVLYHSIPIDDLLKQHLEEIQRVYKLYAASIDVPPPGQKKVMSIREFEAVCSQIKLVNKYLNQRDVAIIFLESQQLSVDEIKRSDHRVLAFVEFIESVARLAYAVGEKRREKDLQAAREAEAERLEMEKKERQKKKKGKQKRKGEQSKPSKKMGALSKLKKAAFKIGKAVVKAKSEEAAERDGLSTSNKSGLSLAGTLNMAMNARDNLYQHLSVFLEELSMVGKVQQPAHTGEKDAEEEDEQQRSSTLDDSVKSDGFPLSPLSPMSAMSSMDGSNSPLKLSP